jgi:hypothetical protein
MSQEEIHDLDRKTKDHRTTPNEAPKDLCGTRLPHRHKPTAIFCSKRLDSHLQKILTNHTSRLPCVCSVKTQAERR